MTIYERIYYNLCRPALHNGKPLASAQGYRGLHAAWYFFFLWHFFYGVIIACLAAQFYQGLIDAAYSPSWLLAIGAAISFLLMLRFIPSNKQLYRLDIQERKKSEKRRDLEMLVSNSAFTVSLVIGLWQFVSALRYTVSP